MLESGLVIKVEPGEEFLGINPNSVTTLKQNYSLNRATVLNEIST
jgi:hypothetical protein